MAKIKLTLIGTMKGVIGEVTEELEFSSAESLYDTLSHLLKPLAENMRKADATGKIPMEPPATPIFLSPAQVIEIGKQPGVVEKSDIQSDPDCKIKFGGTD